MAERLAVRHARAALFDARWADLLAPLAIVAVALPMRLANIGSYTGKADEGTRAEQLLLMARGFRPVRDVFASQGPLSLDIFYPFFVLGGGTLAGARLAVVIYSILCILGIYWVARTVGGRLAGWSAAALLLVSPTFLKNSRLALVEIPALLPATLALGAALAYQHQGRRRWLVLSAASLAIALAIKPMMAPVVPAIGLALVVRRGVRVSDFVLYGAVSGGLMLLIVLLVGPAELYDQLIRYRVGSRQAEGWSLDDNWDMLWGELRWEQPALFGLAILSAGLLALTRPRLGMPLAVWALATLGLLLIYSPLGIKHAALLPPTVAALAGAGIGVGWAGLLDDRAPTATRILAGASGVALLTFLWALPTVLDRDRQAMSVGDAGSEPPYREESAFIQALTGRDDYILVDDAYLAFLNDRPMPPRLVDTSIFRIRSGALSGAEVVAHAEAFDVRLMLLLSDNLRELKKFAEWADENYLVAKINERSNRKDRALYLRNDADLDTARAALRRLTPDARPVDAELGGQMRMRAYSLDPTSVRSGGSTNLTVEWEAVAPIHVDWHPITFLRDADGKLIDQAERSLGGGGAGTSAWTPGRWVFRTSSLSIPSKAPPGEYRLGLGLYDSKAKKMALVTAGPGAGSEEIPLGTLRVR